MANDLEHIPDEVEITPEMVKAVTALNELAKDLHFWLEKYDPGDEPEWDVLTDHQREIYRATIRQILYRDDLLLPAMGWARCGFQQPRSVLLFQGDAKTA